MIATRSLTGDVVPLIDRHDPILKHLLSTGQDLTLENYLKLAYTPDPVPADWRNGSTSILKSRYRAALFLVRWAPGVLFGVLDAPKTRAAQAVLDVQ